MSSRTASAAAVAAVDRRQRLCDVFGEDLRPGLWADWRWQMRHRLTRPEHFEQYLRALPRRAPRAAHGARAFRGLGHAALRVAHGSLRPGLPDPPAGGAARGGVRGPARRHGGPLRRGHDMVDRRAWCTAIRTACCCSRSTPAPSTAATAPARGWSARATSSRCRAASRHPRLPARAHRGARRAALGRRPADDVGGPPRQPARRDPRDPAHRAAAHRQPGAQLPAAADHPGAGGGPAQPPGVALAPLLATPPS